ncbi:MAG: AraC family transcriptional regulator [Lachnospiraceae bacterium]|nr:AraC family transcriptional regulator [Lachnospiraceae bacterium]
MDYSIFENFSLAASVGVMVLDPKGESKFESSYYIEAKGVMKQILAALDCEEANLVALIYGCYQSKRFGGRYVFIAPSGLIFCASYLADSQGNMLSGVLCGPFLLNDYDEYMEIDISDRITVNDDIMAKIRSAIDSVPIKTTKEAKAISEQLFVCASYFKEIKLKEEIITQSGDETAIYYSIEKEEDLLASISKGDVKTANALLNNILGQMLFQSGSNLEVLRFRVVELTVLLSRAALKGGAKSEAILGLNYVYLREIDALSSIDEIVLWLSGVTRRFAQNVFDYAGSKYMDVSNKAISYIRGNYLDKITLQDVAEHVFLSPSYFSKIFKEETGQTPSAYITAVRLEVSKKLLKDPALSIIDIAMLAGFESQSYFTQVFKKNEGCTPGQYRQEMTKRKQPES